MCYNAIDLYYTILKLLRFDVLKLLERLWKYFNEYETLFSLHNDKLLY